MENIRFTDMVDPKLINGPNEIFTICAAEPFWRLLGVVCKVNLKFQNAMHRW